MNSSIEELLSISLSSIKDMIDANTVIGTQINYNNTIIIPVSKLHLGFVSGGSDIKPSNTKDTPLFGGGTGGGLSINPVAFLVIQNDNVKILALDNNTHLAEKLLDSVPKMTEKVKVLFKENSPIDEI